MAASCAEPIAAGSSALTSTGSYSLFGADMGSSSRRRIRSKSMARPLASVRVVADRYAADFST
jgi:hypothetical protein